ncbi:MAG: hydroxymethylbilane synthase [Archaeoglobaceae archaeon]|nr:hydroxymethylbilane synthase [Archaeoglobaceae archaeon]
MRRIVVGTRGSKLALAQAEKVVKKLEEEGYKPEIKIIKSMGDIMRDKPLHEFKGVGAFVRTLDSALADGKVDIVVHSYKDVPSDRIKGTVIAAVLERESPCDAFISRNGKTLDELENNSVIGTSSLRRRAQLKRYREDLRFENLRGNLDTRLRKLKDGLYDAIVVAEAGLIRLNLVDKIDCQRLNPEIFVPSANQGIIAVATRVGEEDLVLFMNHEKTDLEAKVEREVIKGLGVGCAVPVGVYAELKGKVKLICEILDKKYIRVEEKFSRENAVEEAREVAENLRGEIYGQ